MHAADVSDITMHKTTALYERDAPKVRSHDARTHAADSLTDNYRLLSDGRICGTMRAHFFVNKSHSAAEHSYFPCEGILLFLAKREFCFVNAECSHCSCSKCIFWSHKSTIDCLGSN
jgi:hypothetical protein